MANPDSSARRMMCGVLGATILGAAALTARVQGQSRDEVRRVDFRRDVLPVLAENCFFCHGPDTRHREADLRLDQEAETRKLAIVAGKPDESPFVQRIESADPDMLMPPPASGKSLSPDQRELLRRWVDEGAPWAEHWSFASLRPVMVPGTANAVWPRSDLDRFVARRLEVEGLTPAPEADRPTLIRRAYFDLIGLPPTPEQVAVFERDASADAFEKVVDELLRSPHYGERLALDWLDVARYADTNGFQNDFQRSMWPWRDWVIQAFNENKSYDQFLIEQIAGDLLPNPTTEQLMATGFNRNNRTVTEAGSIDEEWRVENAVDRVETTATAFLGLTMGCGRCHDHKYDPISQQDFYRFFAFFNNIEERGVYTETRGNVPPLIPVPTPENRQRLAEFDARLAELDARIEEYHARQEAVLQAWRAKYRTRLDSPRPDSDRAAGQDGAPPSAPPAALVATLNGVLRVETRTETGELAAETPAVYPAGEPRFVPAIPGVALRLEGQEQMHVDLGQAFAAERDAPLSWSLWARVRKPGALLSKMDDMAAYRGFDTIVLDDRRLKVHLIHTWPDNALAVTTKEAVPLDQWFHLCVTYDGLSQAQGIHVFLDGRPLELNLEVTTLSGSLATVEPLRLGRRSSSLFLDGDLADVRFYRGVLTEPFVREAMEREVLAALDAPADAAHDESRTAAREFLERYLQSDLAAQRASLLAERQEYEKNAVQTVMILRDRAEVRPTYLLRRGQYDAPDTSEPLSPDVPGFLPRMHDDWPKNRLGLARWLVDRQNPLTARVAVNRVWFRLFCRGLVDTLDNFGVQGSPPSHPELLDWLAWQFIDSGWDLKRLHKLIMMSATYRQSSLVTPELLNRDPSNELLARGPRYRLPAELIRDNALAVSGLLTCKIGGPSVKPYQPAGLWDELAGGANEGPYVQSTGEDLYRRSLYTYRKRTVSHPTLNTFDAPSWEICQAKRSRTNTPLQSLALLNDITYVEAARHLARRMLREGGDQLPDQLRRGFLLATLRPIGEHELTRLAEGYQRYLSFYREHPDDAERLIHIGESPVDTALAPAELAAMTAVASILLNLDETISKQ